MPNLAPFISRIINSPLVPNYIERWHPTDKYCTCWFNSEELTSFILYMSHQVQTYEIQNKMAFLLNLSTNHNITVENLTQEILLLQDIDVLEELYGTSWDTLLDGAVAYLINSYHENPNEFSQVINAFLSFKA